MWIDNNVEYANLFLKKGAFSTGAASFAGSNAAKNKTAADGLKPCSFPSGVCLFRLFL